MGLDFVGGSIEELGLRILVEVVEEQLRGAAVLLTASLLAL